MNIEIVCLLIAGFFLGTQAQEFGIFVPEKIKEWTTGYSECQKDMENVIRGLKSGELWALKMLDASTKIPAGILTGHFVDYGNFDECLENDKAHFCMTTFALGSDSINRISKNVSSSMHSMTETPLRWATCIPASCPPQVLQKAYQDILKGYDVNVTVRSPDCQSNDRKPLTQRDQIGIWIWGIFIGLAVVSTIYDVFCTMKKVETISWMVAFSFYFNGKKLLSVEDRPETMRPIHGMKFLSICWVMLGHRYFFTLSSSLLNSVNFIEELQKLQSQFFIQGVLAVDTFFVISGFLNSYNLIKVLDKTKRFPCFEYYIHRYIRLMRTLYRSLTPTLAAVVVMYATWYALIGTGPVWNETVAQWKQLCVENWWPTLLYINNYYESAAQCAGQSWYLAVDMQLYWLTPLIVYPLWLNPQVWRYVLWCVLVASSISQFVVSFVYKFRMPFTIGLNLAELEEVTKLIYVPTHTRATPYIIGVILGHYAHGWHQSGSGPVLTKWWVRVGWLITTLSCLGVVFGNFQFSRPIEDHPYNVWESSVYSALHRIGWGGGMAWIIFSCLNNHGGIVNDILSWKIFVPLSRLTYCIFLCHMAIQMYQVGTARTSDYFQHFNQIHRFFGDLIFSVIAAAFLSLVFESPVMVMEKLAKQKLKKRKVKGEDNEGFQTDSSVANK